METLSAAQGSQKKVEKKVSDDGECGFTVDACQADDDKPLDPLSLD